VEVKGDPETLFRDELRRRRLTFDAQARECFLQKIGPSARLLLSELDKLELYAGAQRTITPGDVERLSCEGSEENFFEPIHAFYSADGRRFARAMEQFFASGRELRVLIAAFQRHNRALLQLKAGREADHRWARPFPTTRERGRGGGKVVPLPGEDSDDIFSKNPWYLRQLGKQLETLTLHGLQTIQLALAHCFAEHIGNWGLPASVWIERFLAWMPSAKVQDQLPPDKDSYPRKSGNRFF
jgi:hypothetical protein